MPYDREWGIQDGKGSFSGIIGQLQDKEVDLSSCGLTITLGRNDAVDFSLPLFTDFITIMRKVNQRRHLFKILFIYCTVFRTSF